MTAPNRLHPDDVELLARRVAELIREESRAVDASPTPQLLTAAQVAERIGVTAEWVRDHASQLGAMRIGQGKRPRLRFPLEAVSAALAAAAVPATSSTAASCSRDASDAAPARRRRRPARSDVELLPIRGQAQ